jgi:uncharacterized membrane protein
MDILELLSRLGGEVLANKARATIDGEIVILGRLVGEEWELTEKGQELANLHSNLVVDEAAAAAAGKPARKKAAPAVESETAPVVDTPAAETEQAPAAE